MTKPTKSEEDQTGTMPIQGEQKPSILETDFTGQVFCEKYIIKSELSKGGMGRIFKAEQIALKREVAIKIILTNNDEDATSRFLLEASLTANLEHPNIVSIYDFGRTADGILFLVMELINGNNLQNFVKIHGPLSIMDTLQVAQQMCSALSVAHTKNIVHRDIKPSNIVISKLPGGGLSAKLIDFGLVKHINERNEFTQTGVVLGSPMYMSPEQIKATGVDDRTDIYSLGLTMYYALTGSKPFSARGINSLIHAHLNTEIEPLSEVNKEIPKEHLINWIVHRAVEKDPNNRFPNTLQMLNSLKVCEQHNNSDTSPTLFLEEGMLKSDNEIVTFSTTSAIPFVDSHTYLGDGSALSDNYAQTMSLENLPAEKMMTFPSLAIQNTSLAEPEPARSKNHFLTILTLLLIMSGVLFYSLPNITSSPQVASPNPIPKATEKVSTEVTIKTEPEGVEVYIKDKLKGTAPFTIHLAENETIAVSLRKDQYETIEIELTAQVPEVNIHLKKIVPIEPDPVVKPKRSRARKKTEPPPQKTEQPKEQKVESTPVKKRAKPSQGSGVVDPSW